MSALTYMPPTCLTYTPNMHTYIGNSQPAHVEFTTKGEPPPAVTLTTCRPGPHLDAGEAVTTQVIRKGG